ncbi:unnamed protein product, partial [Amoebophrya sp. A25]
CLLAVHEKKFGKFNDLLDTAKIGLLQKVALSNGENSFDRVYPTLTKLHALADLDFVVSKYQAAAATAKTSATGPLLHGHNTTSSSSSNNKKLRITQGLRGVSDILLKRLSACRVFGDQDLALSISRVALQELASTSFNYDVVRLELESQKLSRKAGRPRAILEDSQLYSLRLSPAKNRLFQEALAKDPPFRTLIEQKDLEALKHLQALSEKSEDADGVASKSVDQTLVSQRLNDLSQAGVWKAQLLAARWFSDDPQKRVWKFDRVCQQQKNAPRPHLDFALFLDDFLQKSKEKQQSDRNERTFGPAGGLIVEAETDHETNNKEQKLYSLNPLDVSALVIQTMSQYFRVLVLSSTPTTAGNSAAGSSFSAISSSVKGTTTANSSKGTASKVVARQEELCLNRLLKLMIDAYSEENTVTQDFEKLGQGTRVLLKQAILKNDATGGEGHIKEVLGMAKQTVLDDTKTRGQPRIPRSAKEQEWDKHVGVLMEMWQNSNSIRRWAAQHQFEKDSRNRVQSKRHPGGKMTPQQQQQEQELEQKLLPLRVRAIQLFSTEWSKVPTHLWYLLHDQLIAFHGLGGHLARLFETILLELMVKHPQQMLWPINCWRQHASAGKSAAGRIVECWTEHWDIHGNARNGNINNAVPSGTNSARATGANQNQSSHTRQGGGGEHLLQQPDKDGHEARATLIQAHDFYLTGLQQLIGFKDCNTTMLALSESHLIAVSSLATTPAAYVGKPILIPLAKFMQVRPSSGSSGEKSVDHGSSALAAAQAEAVFLHGIQDKVSVMTTKVRPKKITFIGSDGKGYSFLAKEESRGDLKKDKRALDLGMLVNKLLRRCAESARRKLELRTYKVTPITEKAGLLEWVSNTNTMKNCIEAEQKLERLHKRYPKARSSQPAQNWATNYFDYVYKLLPSYPPVFHLWYQRTSKDPSEWLVRRNEFTKSLACWSMLGYVMGLGDRHCENILIDQVAGAVVHVDFDCLFGKGLYLTKPEVVPFRLTQNCIAPMGITGIEGLYRHSAEIFMSVMRSNRTTIGSVLESFLADPFLDWKQQNRVPINIPKTVKEL